MVREKFVKTEQIKYKSTELYEKLLNGNKIKELKCLHIEIEKTQDIKFLEEFRENKNKLCQIYLTIKQGVNEQKFLKVIKIILRNMKLKKIGMFFENIEKFEKRCLKETLQEIKKTYKEKLETIIIDQFDLEIENINMKNNINLKELIFKSFDFT